jgi:hypothetical protein
MSKKLLYVHHFDGGRFVNKSNWSVIIKGAFNSDFIAIMKTDMIISTMEQNNDLQLMFIDEKARALFFSKAPKQKNDYLNFLNEQKRILLEK